MGHVSKLRNTSALSVSYYYTERTFFFSPPIFSVITGHPPSIARSQQLARLHVSNTTIWISQALALTGVTVFTQRLLSQGCESHRQLLPPGSSPSLTPCWSSSSQPQQPCFFVDLFSPLLPQSQTWPDPDRLIYINAVPCKPFRSNFAVAGSPSPGEHEDAANRPTDSKWCHWAHTAPQFKDFDLHQNPLQPQSRHLLFSPTLFHHTAWTYCQSETPSFPVYLCCGVLLWASRLLGLCQLAHKLFWWCRWLCLSAEGDDRTHNLCGLHGEYDQGDLNQMYIWNYIHFFKIVKWLLLMSAFYSHSIVIYKKSQMSRGTPIWLLAVLYHLYFILFITMMSKFQRYETFLKHENHTHFDLGINNLMNLKMLILPVWVCQRSRRCR